MCISVAPDTVTVTGQKLGKAGEQIQLTCTSSHSNPAASLIWLSKGLTVAGAQEQVSASSDGGYITVSTLTVTLTNQESTVLFMCQASNYSRVVDTIELSVLCKYSLNLKSLVLGGFFFSFVFQGLADEI